MKRHIPNLLTCGNLLTGTLGIIYCFDGYAWKPIGAEMSYYTPALFVWIASLFDFLDGFAAKWLKVSSAIGKELDSLADVISFGLLPAIFMFKLIGTYGPEVPIEYAALLIAVFSALRLAVFNVDTEQTESFKGLPTPANTLFITGLVFIPQGVVASFFNPVSLAVISLIFCGLMVSRIDLFALKFKDFSWKSNSLRFTFLLLSVLLLFLFKLGAISMIILLYILLSLVYVTLNRRSKPTV